MKKGAIELSIGTIVIVVLAMSMLILGMVLVKNIFGGATDITEMTIDQVRNEITKSWGEEKRLMIYPDSKQLRVRSGSEGAFAVGIKNLLTGADSTTKQFRYEISVAERGNCQVGERELEQLIVTGKEITPTPLAPGSEPIVRKVTLSIPDGFPLCTFSYKIQAYYDGNNAYTADFIDITIR